MEVRGLFDRRDVLKMGGAGLLGMLAGALGHRAMQRKGGLTTFFTGQSFGVGSFAWTVEIRGGYGLLFLKDGKGLKVMSAKGKTCPLGYDHRMLLVIDQSMVDVDADTTFSPQNNGDSRLYWELNGMTTFIEGMIGEGISARPGTPWDKLQEPCAPLKPLKDSLWDDQIWLPERARAVNSGGIDDLASRSIVFPDGDLAILHPNNDWGVYGRWVFKDPVSGKERRKALTDGIRLTKVLSGRIGIQTDGGKIYLKPKSGYGVLPMQMQHKVDLDPEAFMPGTHLPHFAPLYEFVYGAVCNTSVIPYWEPRPDVALPNPDQASPGDLCPPMPLDEM